MSEPGLGAEAEDIGHTIDHSSQVFHISEVVVCRSFGASDRLKDLFTEPCHYLGVFSEHVHGKRQRSRSLTTGINVISHGQLRKGNSYRVAWNTIKNHRLEYI
jgi:hypothetical protein